MGPDRSTTANVQAVMRAFEEAGIVFQAEDELLGPGVRLKKESASGAVGGLQP